MEIAGHRYTVKLVVFPMCARDVILSMHFLSKSSAVIDLHEGMILLWLGFPEPDERDADRKPVQLARNHVTQPTRSGCWSEGKPTFLQASRELQKGTLTCYSEAAS